MMNRHNRWKLGVHILLIIIAVFYLVPIGMTFLYSFKTDQEVLTKSALDLPERIHAENFLEAVKKLDYFRSFYNSMIITCFSVVCIVLLSSMAGYGLSRGQTRIFSVVFMIFVAGLLIPLQAIFVPTYILGVKLRMLNKFWGLIFLYTANSMPFAVFMMMGFAKGIPIDMEYAARIDGCSVPRIYLSVILPLMRPAVVTLAVLRAQIIWNDYLMPKLFLQKQSMQTLPVRLTNMFGQYRYAMNMAFAAIILVSIPVIVFFLFNQKYVEKGITAGAVKG